MGTVLPSTRFVAKQVRDDLVLALRDGSGSMRIADYYLGDQDWQVIDADGNGMGMEGFLGSLDAGVADVATAWVDFKAELDAGYARSLAAAGYQRNGLRSYERVSGTDAHDPAFGTDGSGELPQSTIVFAERFDYDWSFEQASGNGASIQAAQVRVASRNESERVETTYYLHDDLQGWFPYTGVSRPVHYVPAGTAGYASD